MISPIIFDRKGRATLYGRFVHSFRRNLALEATITEQEMIGISNLHPVDDPALVGSHIKKPIIRRCEPEEMIGISNLHPVDDPTLVGSHIKKPIIRRCESDSSRSRDSSLEEIQPFHGDLIPANVMAPRFEKAHLVDSAHDTPNSASTVAGIILHFEILGKRASAMKVQNQQPTFRAKKPIAEKHKISLELFLTAIGEVPPPIISTKLVRIASEWHSMVDLNQETQLDDSSHVSLSSSLNFLGAALNPTCANLEVQGIEEVVLLRAVSHQRELRGLL
jgi:hypothetical protein